MRNHYAYRVFKTLTSPVYSGTVTAESMEDAVTQVMKSCKVTAVKEFHNEFEYNSFICKGVKVGILIYANPEEF